MPGLEDVELAEVMHMARAIRVTIHIRGSDTHPVVEIRDKRSRQVIGGIELKRRLQTWNS